MNGIIPVLQNIVKTDRPLKEFALPILCDMAHSGKRCRRLLWQNDGLEFYISLLSDPYWQVTALDAIHVWLQEETARVEEKLQDPESIDALVRCFTTSKTNAFENTLEPLQKLLRLSPPIAHAVGRREFFARIVQKLSHNKAVVRLNLLKILRTICDASEQREAMIREYGMYPIVSRVAEKDTAVLVRNMANELVKACNERLKGSIQNPRRRSHAPGMGSAIGSSPISAQNSRRHVSSLWSNTEMSLERPGSAMLQRVNSASQLGMHRSISNISNMGGPRVNSISSPVPQMQQQHGLNPPRLRLRATQSVLGLRGEGGLLEQQQPQPPSTPQSPVNGRYRAANNYVPRRIRGSSTLNDPGAEDTRDWE